VVAAALAVLMASIGLATPKIALAMSMLTALGLALLLVGSTIAALLARVRTEPRSAFAPDRHQRPPQSLPTHVGRLVPPIDTKRAALTAGARTGIVTVATERLWAHHGLNLYEPSHHAAIEALAGGELWDVIRPERREPHGSSLPRPHLEHARLGSLVDRLEQL
jgi:hypothetical protein